MSCTYTHRYVYKRTCALRLVGLISQTPPRCAHHHSSWSVYTYKYTWQLELLPPLTHCTSSAAPLLILSPSERDAEGKGEEKDQSGSSEVRRRIGRGSYPLCRRWLQAALQVTNTSVTYTAHLLLYRWQALGGRQTEQWRKMNNQGSTGKKRPKGREQFYHG